LQAAERVAAWREAARRIAHEIKNPLAPIRASIETLRCLRNHGVEGASVRRIADEAGVSMGLINHYFPGSASLIAAAYESLAGTLLAAIRQHVERAKPEPRARLQAFLEAYSG